MGAAERWKTALRDQFDHQHLRCFVHSSRQVRELVLKQLERNCVQDLTSCVRHPYQRTRHQARLTGNEAPGDQVEGHIRLEHTRFSFADTQDLAFAPNRWLIQADGVANAMMKLAKPCTLDNVSSNLIHLCACGSRSDGIDYCRKRVGCCLGNSSHSRTHFAYGCGVKTAPQ
jgi:hypothetical protein